MLAIGAVVCFVLAAFKVNPDDVNLVWLGLAFLSAHFAYPVTLPRGGRTAP